MKDPYVSLGVDPTATDDELKKAYRDLVRKYHPDSYQNNPLADLAEEKMKEINEAYEIITKLRKGEPVQGQHTSNSQSYTPQPKAPVYQQIRVFLDAGQLVDAKQLLDQQAIRDAEWNFCMGVWAYKTGMLAEANLHFNQAIQQEPQNQEYQQAFYSTQSTGAYPPQSFRSPLCCCCPCDGDCCTTMLCLNCLCGGDGCCCC